MLRALALPVQIPVPFRRRRARAMAPEPAGTAPCWGEILFSGRDVIGIRGAVPDWLGHDLADMAAVLDALGHARGPVADAMGALTADGTPFASFATGPRGCRLRLEGRVEGLAVLLRLRPATAEEDELLARLRDRRGLRRDLARAQARAEATGQPVLELDRRGRITWQNAAATAMLGAQIGHESDLPGLAGAPEGPPVALRRPTGADLGWARIGRTGAGGGRTLVSISDISAEKRAESQLKSFVATLTETFANLDMGLAVFDREHRLSLFNPALSDLFELDPAELAARPSLRGVLERLRQRRMTPEAKDFTAWRRQLAGIGGADGPDYYREDWTLPSGRIVRVTGRPHPMGGLAFVFEDISSRVELERRYLAEIELGQATLDHLREGVAVFDTAGFLIFSNTAFDSMWGLTAQAEVQGIDAAAVIAHLSARCAADDVWPGLERYLLASDRPARTEATIRPLGGAPRRLALCPLPDGSTLMTVDVLAATDGRHLIPVRHAEEGLAAIATRYLARYGTRLRFELDHVLAAPREEADDLRRALWGLCISVGAIARHGMSVAIRGTETPDRIILEATLKLAEPDGARLDAERARLILARHVGTRDAEVAVEPLGAEGGLRLTARIPSAQQALSLYDADDAIPNPLREAQAG